MIVESLRYHRNGSFGAGYFTARIRTGPTQRLGAIIFDQAEHVAILDDDGRSYRCEDFEDALRAFVASDAGQRMAWPSQFPANDDAPAVAVGSRQ